MFWCSFKAAVLAVWGIKHGGALVGIGDSWWVRESKLVDPGNLGWRRMKMASWWRVRGMVVNTTVVKITSWGYFISIYALQALSQVYMERPDSVGTAPRLELVSKPWFSMGLVYVVIKKHHVSHESISIHFSMVHIIASSKSSRFPIFELEA